jgi:hypothetical protein
MTYREALQGFPNTSQESLHKNNKKLTFTAVPAGRLEVTTTLNFISECTVQLRAVYAVFLQ